jgi:tetratricopeptide (TPR) repeat protein
MRISIPISLMFVLILLALSAYAILEPSEVSIRENESLADKLFEASQGGGILRPIDTKYPATPQQTRALKENNLNWTPSLMWTPNPEKLSTHTTNRTGSQGQVNKSSDALNWSGKGNALDERGKHEEAIQAYDRAIELDPKLVPAWVGKGYALGRLGKNEAAMQAFDKAIEINPQNAIVWRLKGIILKKLGRNTESQAAYAKAKELGYTGPT